MVYVVAYIMSVYIERHEGIASEKETRSNKQRDERGADGSSDFLFYIVSI